MTANTVVPRFCFVPAATDDAGIATLHTAAFSWALARAAGGDFVLGIDDLARKDAPLEAAETVLGALAWTGIDWDEGPDVGGPHRPYSRSQRAERYRAVAAELVENGYGYEGDDPDSPAGGDTTIHLRLPENGQTMVEDGLRGPLNFENEALADPILVDADGTPRSLLADVVDAHDMAITHAVFGARELETAPLRAHVYRALGWEEPVYVHLPAVVGVDGTPVDYPLSAFQEGGYLPDAVFNYLLLLGWSPPGGEEIVGKWKVRQQFSLDDVAPAPAGFAWEHLKRINRHYLQQKSDKALADLIAPFLEDAYGELPASEAWLVQLTGLIRERLDTLADAVDEADWAFSDVFVFSEAAEAALEEEASRPVLVQLVAELAHVVLLDEQTARRILDSLHDRQDLSEEAVTRPVRAALIGTVAGPPLPAIMGLLGKQRCLQRIAAILR